MPKLEKETMKIISQKLDLYELVGNIIWKSRLNCGRIKTYFGSYVQLNKSGTWDWVVVFRNRNDGLSLLFIEGKSDTGKLRIDQKSFQVRYSKKDVYFLIIIDPKDLDKFIDKYSKDFVDELPDKL